MDDMHAMSTPWTLRLAFWLPVLTIGAAGAVAFTSFLERVRIGLEVGDFAVGAVVVVAMGGYGLVLFAALRGSAGARLVLTVLAVAVVGGLLVLPLPVGVRGGLLLAGSPSLVSVALTWTPGAHAFIRARSALR